MSIPATFRRRDQVFSAHPRPHQGGLSYHLSHRPNVTPTTSGRQTRAPWISWVTSGRCSSSVISPPVRAGSSSCSGFLPGISTEQLRSRLNRMVADGLLTRQRYREVPPRVDYELTERSRELIPVLGALARWGYDWTWSAPRPGEDVNVGAIFRLAPGILEPPPGLEGTVELIVEAEGEAARAPVPDHAQGWPVEVSEVGGAQPTASVRGTVAAWVRALGPERLDRIAADLRPRRPRRRGAGRLRPQARGPLRRRPSPRSDRGGRLASPRTSPKTASLTADQSTRCAQFCPPRTRKATFRRPAGQCRVRPPVDRRLVTRRRRTGPIVVHGS